MNIHLADVTLHTDQALVGPQAGELENALRDRDGVVSVHHTDATPHLFLVDYNPEKVASDQLLETAHDLGLKAQLIGL